MSYIWCGRDGWCYAFNVIDVFRQWLGFAFDTRATRHAAIMSVTNAVAARNPRHDSQLILKHEIENFLVILHAFYMLRITFLENLSRKRMISNYGSRLRIPPG